MLESVQSEIESVTLHHASSGEAVGHLLCVLKHNSLLLAVQSQADKIVRSLWARPSVGGAHVVATVLSNPAHYVEW